VLKSEITFEKYYQEANQAPIPGWDFTFLNNRYLAEDLPWDYKKIVEKYLKKSKSLLDIDTGGGEFLSNLKPLPAAAFATENYKPNIVIAKQRLEPLGIHVVECDAELELPFDDESFELVINRHGLLRVPELLRVLRKNGIFVTQQVGAQNNIQPNHFFKDISRDNMKWDLKEVVSSFKTRNIELVKAEEYYP